MSGKSYCTAFALEAIRPRLGNRRWDIVSSTTRSDRECFFAVVEVISGEPYEPAVTHEWEAQWPWAFDIKVIKKKLRLSDSPQHPRSRLDR